VSYTKQWQQFSGTPTPLTICANLLITLRERAHDFILKFSEGLKPHSGAHKMNNVIGQVCWSDHASRPWAKNVFIAGKPGALGSTVWPPALSTARFTALRCTIDIGAERHRTPIPPIIWMKQLGATLRYP